MTVTATVGLVRAADAKLWHVLQAEGEKLTVCGANMLDAVEIELGVDARVFAHRGRRVCASCRRRIP